MGGLFSGGGKHAPAVEIDFEGKDDAPGEDEQKLFAETEELVRQIEHTLYLMDEYKGAANECRLAVNDPRPEVVDQCFAKLIVCVDSVSQIYHFAQTMEQIVPTLLFALTSGVQGNAEECKQLLIAQIKTKQALVKQLSKLLSFSLVFDQSRMSKAVLPNDFSYYRRFLPKCSAKAQFKALIKIKDDEAGEMALFSAEPCPMLASMKKAGEISMSKMQSDGKSSEAVCNGIAVLINSCFHTLKSKTLKKSETIIGVARAMTCAVVLYDHISSQGVFTKNGPVETKHILKFLLSEMPEETMLTNAIRYSSKTFKDSPESIQELFEEK